MRKFLTPLTLILWSVPYLILHYTIGANEAIEVTNSLIISMTLGVAIAFSSSLCPALKRFPPKLKASDALALGAMIMAASVALIFIGLWLARVTNELDNLPGTYWRDHVVFALARWYLALGIGFMMLTTRSINDEIPPASYVTVGKWIGGGLLIVLLFFSLGWT